MKKNQCPRCLEKFSVKSHLRQHLKRSNVCEKDKFKGIEQKPFKCQFCNRAFPSQPLLEIHFNTRKHLKRMEFIKNKGKRARRVTNTSNMNKFTEESGPKTPLYTSNMNKFTEERGPKTPLYTSKTSKLKNSKNVSTVSKRKPISATMRKAVWLKYIGKHMEAKCYAGCGDIINCFNFDCGHVIAHSKGGLTTLDNLRPICRGCNSSMGTQDMNEFIKENGFTIPRYTSKSIGDRDNDSEDIITVSSKLQIDIKKKTDIKKTIINSEDIVTVSSKPPTNLNKKPIANHNGDSDSESTAKNNKMRPTKIQKTG
jgi:5-methylcytosine-specific restriction endonuclease McrA